MGKQRATACVPSAYPPFPSPCLPQTPDRTSTRETYPYLITCHARSCRKPGPLSNETPKHRSLGFEAWATRLRYSSYPDKGGTASTFVPEPWEKTCSRPLARSETSPVFLHRKFHNGWLHGYRPSPAVPQHTCERPGVLYLCNFRVLSHMARCSRV